MASLWIDSVASATMSPDFSKAAPESTVFKLGFEIVPSKVVADDCCSRK